MEQPTTVATGIARLAATAHIGPGPFGQQVLVTTPERGARVVVHTDPHCGPHVRAVPAADLPTLNSARRDLDVDDDAFRFSTGPDLVWCPTCSPLTSDTADTTGGDPVVREAWYWLAEAAGWITAVEELIAAAEAASASRLRRSVTHYLNQVAEPLASAVSLLLDPPKRTFSHSANVATVLATVQQVMDELGAAEVPAAELTRARVAQDWVVDQVAPLRKRCAALVAAFPAERLAPEDGPTGQSLVLVEAGLVKPVRGVIGQEHTRRTVTLVTAPVLARQDTLAVLVVPTGLVRLCDTAVLAAAPVPPALPDGFGAVALAATMTRLEEVGSHPALFADLVNSALAATC